MTRARRLAAAKRPAPSNSAGSPSRPKPRTGRRRARLSVSFSFLALLAGALGLFPAAPAHAQSVTIQLSAPRTVVAGSPIEITATLSAAQAGWISLGIGYEGITVSPQRYSGGGSLFIEAGKTSATFEVSTFADVPNRRGILRVSISSVTKPSSVGAVDKGTPVDITIVGKYEVQNLSVWAGDAGELDVTWVRPLSGTVTGYVVHYTSNAAVDDYHSIVGPNAWIDASHAGVTTARTISNLELGTSYRVRVRAVISGSGSAARDWVIGRGTPLAKATLTGLLLDGSTDGSRFLEELTLSPPFAPETRHYTATVAGSITHVRLRPLADFDSTEVIAYRADDEAGATTLSSENLNTEFALNPGDNVFVVDVTATGAGGGNQKKYTFTVTRQGGSGPPPTGGPGGPPPADDDDDDEPEPEPPPPPPPPPLSAASFDVEGAECGEDPCRVRTGASLRFIDTSTGRVLSRSWDFGNGRRPRDATVRHAWSEPGFYTVTLRVSDDASEFTASRVFLVEAAKPAGTCVADDETRCLRDSRFAVEMDWWTGDGEGGPGKVVREGTNDSGLFQFFGEDNWEVLIKVLNGCSVNEHVWVYGASATTLGYRIRVTDTVAGVVREYRNEDGNLAEAITDGEAFAGACDGGSSPAMAPADVAPPLDPPLPVVVEAPSGEGGCTESATTLCLLDGRYEVSASWSTPAAAGEESGETGPGRVVRARTPDSGLFHFFGPDNWEMLVKVLDGCSYNGHHWVFAASATDLGLDLVVRDTVTGAVKNYVKDAGGSSPAVADLSAFPDACRAD